MSLPNTFFSADQGRCQYDNKDVRRSIFLQHYGGSLHSWDFYDGDDKDLLDIWGGEYDRLMAMTAAIRAEDPCQVWSLPWF